VNLLQRELRLRIDRATGVLGRMAPGPMLVRAAVAVLAVLSLALALPEGLLLSRYAVIILVVAVLPGLAPRGWLVTAVIIGAAVGWVVTSLLYSESATVPRLIGLSVALYLLHSTAALAAALPYDANVAITLVVPWALRALGVAVGSAGVGVFALGGTGLLGEHSYLLASIVGVAVVAGLVWLLARLR
jgi:hypothetical protein